MALSADLNADAAGVRDFIPNLSLFLTSQQKDTDEYWRRLVSKHFTNEPMMTISLPKEGSPDPKHLGHTAIAQTFKAIWMSGIRNMSFSIDGAREHERQIPGGPMTFVLHCTQARWRMHYFSGYMVELHGTLKVMCTLSYTGPAWRVLIQQFDLACGQGHMWLSKTAIAAARLPGLIQRRNAMTLGTTPGVGPDAESNRYLRQGEVFVPTTPVVLHGLPVSAVQTMEVRIVFLCTGWNVRFSFLDA